MCPKVGYYNNNNNRDCPKKCLLDLQRGARIVICDCEPPTNECGQLKYRPNEHDGIPIGYERFQVACWVKESPSNCILKSLQMFHTDRANSEATDPLMPATERKDVRRLIAKEKLQFIADRPIITRYEEPASEEQKPQ